MNKNLVLVQNGYPHSTTSGTEVDSLDITNFFKFEKDVVPSVYASRYANWWNISGYFASLAPFNFDKAPSIMTEIELQQCTAASAWYEKEGALKYNNTFKHYSVSFLLFAVRMQKGYLGTDVTITSRLPSDSPLKLRFCDIGETLEDFQKIAKFSNFSDKGNYTEIHPHKLLSNALSIPTLNQYNHCFLAALFSDSAYLKESGTKLLNNEPLLNISWTETAFTTEG